MADFKKLQGEFIDAADFLVALGDEKRQAIILTLLEKGSCEGLRVTDLTEATKLSRPAVSHHLKILRVAKLVDYHSVGTKNYYYFNHDTTELKKLMTLLQHVMKIMSEGSETQ